MVCSAYVRTNVIRALTRCRIISRIGTGIDKIDIDQATACGIVVTNVPDFSTNEVADHTLALLLNVARCIKENDTMARQGRRPDILLQLHRLTTRTLGIIGFGRIGRAVAQRATAFGMTVLACDPALSPGENLGHNVTVADRDTVLASADYLCLFCPLTAKTRRMIGMSELRKMKPTAAIVNTGRGELINEDDLAMALRDGVIRAAALDVHGHTDVFAEDGFATTHPLFHLPNVLISPHVAALSQEACFEVAIRAAQAIADAFAGRPAKHPVNPTVVPRPING
jgi:D-3-phosphoglycerate dehydrogenase